MKASFTTILRLVLAVGLIVFGLNKIAPTPFIPLFEMPLAAANFLESLENTGYVFYVIAIIEIVVGVLLLINKWVPFALLLLAPISLNILLFHLFLDISDVLVAIVIVALNTILIYKYWRVYRPLFQ